MHASWYQSTSMIVQRAAVLAAVLAMTCNASAAAKPPLRRIAEIQGSGARSPLLGQEVIVEAVLSGDFGEGMGGVFVQSLKPDRDAKTAEGLFVLLPERAPALRRGQKLRIQGRVVEIGPEGRSLTALEQVTLRVIGRARIAARPIARLPVDAAAWESMEAEWIALQTPLHVVEHQGLRRHGELGLSTQPVLWQPTEKAAPGEAARAMAVRNQASTLVVDDGDLRENPASAKILPEAPDDAAPLRIGSVVGDLTGIVDQRGAGHRLQLTQALRVLRQDPRPPVPEVPGSLRIAAINLLNLFNGDGLGGGFDTSRGAKSQAQFERQRNKLLAAIRELDVSVIGLNEVENDGEGPQSALAQLVAALNAQGRDQWDWARSRESAGVDEIKVALIYRRDLLQAVGEARYLHGGAFGTRSRPPLLQHLRRREGGPTFAVVVNHFKSKGCGRGEEQAKGHDEDQRDGQGCFNAARVDSAQRLLGWLPKVLSPQAQGGVVLLGDFNAYAMEDPIQTFTRAGYRDAFALHPGTQAPYSYIFSGLRGRLDHALLSPAMSPYLRGAAEWHSSAAEQDQFDYHQDQDGDVWRISDHDPLLLGFEL